MIDRVNCVWGNEKQHYQYYCKMLTHSTYCEKGLKSVANISKLSFVGVYVYYCVEEIASVHMFF